MKKSAKLSRTFLSQYKNIFSSRRSRSVARYLVVAALAGLILPACESSPKEPANWSSDMQGFAHVLAESMPLIHKSTPYTSEDRESITKIADKYRGLSKSVSKNHFLPSQDPTFIRAVEALEEELDDIRLDIKEGKDRQAARRLGSVSHFCISCHTMREGYEGEMSRSWNKHADKLSSQLRAEYFAATRQFDQALIEYEKVLSDKNIAQKNSKAWNDSALRMLAIIVRVKNNPNLTLEMLSRFFDVGSYPTDLRDKARVWQREVKKWEAQEKTKSTPIALASVEKLMKESEALKGGGGLIQDLRASRIMHLLKSGAFKNRSEQQKLYYYSGVVAQRLHDLNIWEEPQDYFVLCVKRDAKSKTANLCRSGYKNFWEKFLGEVDMNKWPRTVQKEWQSIK